ncbi:flagellar biosynthetic protein FliR [Jannaschia aquimarina]|uniref:Flagellar biosynthesis protein FliR n=1 Tax=Jannaschia aquimarina TaxID=935700 RepID=A0A0D1CHZ5_9RHOB|nr:flagellar biosynthetic protein FliR [Jannaschia aquimarina]KIT14292.1 flagellar biosynthesis protein FliR [Jannaschia aquimarina]SNS50183.1 flagellar biosynthetic protein FliR [Jannaschia aquimarina]
MTALAPLIEALHLPVVATILAFLRVGGVMILLPAFGERTLPARIRLVVSFMLAIVLGPLIPREIVPEVISPGLIIAETSIGLALGAILRITAQILLLTGAIAAQATSLAQLFGAQMAETSSAIGNLLNIAGLSLLMAAGLHLLVIDLLLRSWDVFPPGMVMPGADMATWGLGRVSSAFALALALAAPFVIGSVLYNLALGVINKAMPQLMVALVGAPAITGLSLVLLAASAALILTTWREEALSVLADPLALR